MKNGEFLFLIITFITISVKTQLFPKMAKNLANWTPDDGPPFDPQRDLKFTPIGPPKATYRILSDEKAEKVADQIDLTPRDTYPFTLEICSHDITRFLFIDKWEVLALIGDMKNIFDLDDFTDTIYIYTDYPFSKMVEISIPPLESTYLDRTSYFFTVGYILWEIAKVYEDIFSKKWEEVGVYGHKLSDLGIESIDFFEGKTKAVLSLGS